MGVNCPDQMPPTMMTGMRSAGPAALKAAQISAAEARLSPLSQPVFFPYHMQTPIRASAMMKAGMTPDMES